MIRRRVHGSGTDDPAGLMHPLILGMLQLLEMSEADADDLWRAAGQIG